MDMITRALHDPDAQVYHQVAEAIGVFSRKPRCIATHEAVYRLYDIRSGSAPRPGAITQSISLGL